MDGHSGVWELEGEHAALQLVVHGVGWGLLAELGHQALLGHRTGDRFNLY